ncbi:nitroreductase family protein [candidate division KSB1 bacterium]|nr:nitroreductase family protein [candidate division KSB1 bacterium]
MEFYNVLFGRRSIRKYSGQLVPEQSIQNILKAAMAAPSAGNEQPWQFVVIRERKVLDAIPNVHPYADMMKEAQAAILVCGDISLERHEGYWVQDCAAATQNLLLAVQAEGLGGVWLGVYPREPRMEGIKELVCLPAHVIPFSLIALGYPVEEKGPSNRFKPERIHTDRW